MGSLNQDVVLRVQALPLPGETVLAHATMRGPGGKGLNQAVAARRAGAATAMFGAVGEDQAGFELCAFAADEGIDTAAIARLADTTTGAATVIVDRSGENAIIVAAGGNGAVDEAAAMSAIPSGAKVALCQLEVPVPAVERFLAVAGASGIRTILNAAPFVQGAAKLFDLCEIVIVNETELAAYAGIEVVAGLANEDIVRLARGFLSTDGQTLVVTLGARGLVRVTLNDAQWHHAQPVSVVDTTGAGDCFCGVLAASLAEGLSIAASSDRAMFAASLCVTRAGAALAMPQRVEFTVD